jgi:putative component of membrane protein insertase Oxa1/YidC/SpoIIIJ protein YidD
VFKLFADLKPVPEIVAHVVAAERQHGHRVSSNLSLLAVLRCGALAGDGGGEEDPVRPVERLKNKRSKSSAPASEQHGADSE